MRHRLQSVPKPKPFPYKEKRYNFFRALFDPTPDRLDENSKLIVVEGPPAAGKGKLAKELAQELEMVSLLMMNTHLLFKCYIIPSLLLFLGLFSCPHSGICTTLLIL